MNNNHRIIYLLLDSILQSNLSVHFEDVSLPTHLLIGLIKKLTPPTNVFLITRP